MDVEALNSGLTHLQYFSREDLERCGRGELFGAGNAQLPIDAMLMMDEISNISQEGGKYGKGMMTATLRIRPELWFFACHFEGDPVMPGCLGLDALWQMLGFYLAWLGNPGRGRALGVDEVRFTGQILPTNHQVTYTLDIKRLIQRKLVMGIADGEVAVDGKVIYVAQNLRVGLFRPEHLSHFGDAA